MKNSAIEHNYIFFLENTILHLKTLEERYGIRAKINILISIVELKVKIVKTVTPVTE